MSKTQTDDEFTELENSVNDIEEDTTPDHLWFPELVAICNCDSVPQTLLSRALHASKDWGNDGELLNSQLSLYTLYSNSTVTFSELASSHSVSWLQRHTLNSYERNELHQLYEGSKRRVEENMSLSAERLLDILIMMMLALPEPWCEIPWEAVEDDLWEVLQSTCLPLLGVITLEELKKYLSRHLR
jgi:hypothetical protein